MSFKKTDVFHKHFLADSENDALQLYKEYKPVITLLSKKYSGYGADCEDLFQEGLIGLARATRLFDVQRSSEDKFKTFAIYYIKNAMREFATKQSITVKTPQYLKDCISLFVKLKELLEQAGEILDDVGLMRVFSIASRRPINTELDKSIAEVVQKIKNLASRSSVAVIEIIKRIEALPITIDEFDDEYVYTKMPKSADEIENLLIDGLMLEKTINFLLNNLTDDEFNLLWDKYVLELPTTEMVKKYNISRMTINTKVNKIVFKLRKLYHQGLFKNEINTNSTEA